MDFYDPSNQLDYDDRLIQEKLGLATYWSPPVKNVAGISNMEQRLHDAKHVRELELRDQRDQRILAEIRSLKQQAQRYQEVAKQVDCSCKNCQKKNIHDNDEPVAPLSELLNNRTFMFITILFIAFCAIQYMWQQQISNSVDELRQLIAVQSAQQPRAE